jgi:cellulose synthase/poly-beta-1,6-N-acetylglucosamine synthase-like glycosyltransferase
MLAERTLGAAPSQRDVQQLDSAAARIAVLIPCYNKELTVADVVHQFRMQLPGVEIFVFDNNSSDGTVEAARRAGATVVHERRQGKGYVVQTMFQRVTLMCTSWWMVTRRMRLWKSTR